MSNPLQPSPQQPEDDKPVTFGEIMSDLKRMSEMISHAEPPDMGNYLFRVHTAGTWMRMASKRPIPKMLFGEFWYQGELCILFADSNLGKSILAVQIGNSISSNQPIAPFKLEADPQAVLYFDFELADKQFEARYSVDFTDHYPFNRNFLRAEMDSLADKPKKFATFEEFLDSQLEHLIITSKARVLIIDNLTYLRTETERAKDALPLMKSLKALKAKYDLSILALAHTPKRDTTRPITRNDLQGSKMLMNFCDSAFAIGESSQDKSLRYLKQIKQRNTEERYGADNICLFSINKPHNFLQYEFENYGQEYKHLRKPEEEDSQRETLKLKISELKTQGKSLRDIGKELGISYMKVDRLLKDSD